MPSPFPGMDPYLEGSLWMTVHTQLCAEIARQLAPKLRPRYLALTTERLVYEEPESAAITTSELYPDVSVMEDTRQLRVQQSAGLMAAPLLLPTVVPTPVPHVTVEIRDAAQRRLVTAIDVLSLTNKRGDGRSEYLAKRRRVLLSDAHLLEVDLLHDGQRVPMQRPLPQAAYFVVLSRVESRPLAEVWPIQLSDSLPSVAVPLLSDDADAWLDLQLAFGNVYDLLGYDLAVDYSRRPENVRLSPDEFARVEARLGDRGA